jgi:dCTP deaminase
MIEPFEPDQVKQGKISFGTSSYGYDFRVDRHFKVFKGSNRRVLDPKDVDEQLFEDVEADTFVLDSGTFVLAQSVEYFRIPRDILTICAGKSTYARCGILVNVTPFEPEWEGHVTMSISNTGSAPVRLYAGEGIAQLVFLSADEICRVSYRDRKGKYQAQQGIVLSKVDLPERR